MKLIIDIDDNLFTRLFDNGVDNYDDAVNMAKAIRKGIPLPKGHGRLIDADETLKRHCVDLCREKLGCHEDCLIYDLFHLAPTIIEADKAESEGA